MNITAAHALYFNRMTNLRSSMTMDYIARSDDRGPGVTARAAVSVWPMAI
jgi:hypothetical protein